MFSFSTTKLWTLVLCALTTTLAHIDTNYRIDVHSHPIPDIWLDALKEAGHPVINGSLIVEGFHVPEWSLAGHLASMDDYGLNYSILSITAPGVNFLASKPKKAQALARQLNHILYNYTQTHPTKLGALCLLPLPNVKHALAEINVYSISDTATWTYLTDYPCSTVSTNSTSPA